MPCVGAMGCSEPLKLDMTIDGLAIGFCDKHLTLAKTFIERGSTANSTGTVLLTDQQFSEDYLKLYAALRSKELFGVKMDRYMKEVSKLASKSRGRVAKIMRQPPEISLTKSMQYYEGLCWFDTQKKVMSGLLTADEFWGSIKKGYMVKDPGPGQDHGEFSHRLQWHYIMRIVTDDFSVPKTDLWHHTPLQLFCGMGEEGRARNIWGAILEGNGTVGGTPGDPAWVNEYFRKGNDQCAAFSAAMNKRYNKRRDLVEEIRAFIKARYPAATIHDLATQPPLPVQVLPTDDAKTRLEKKMNIAINSVNLHTIKSHLYKWKISGCPTIHTKDVQNLDLKIALEIWATDDIQRKFNKKRKEYHVADYGHGGLSEGLLLHGAAYLKDTKPISDRLLASETAFNSDYNYSTKFGATPM